MTVRRLKTYTGSTGFVYQYYFVGKRRVENPTVAPATEYIFDVSSNRKNTYAISIVLSQLALDAWAAQHQRSLTEAEQYAAVKMRLFQAFDEIENLLPQTRLLEVTQEQLATALAVLGVE